MTQIELHKKIDGIVKNGPNETAHDFVNDLCTKFDDEHRDGKQYFFTKADERWLDWLWQNGFLDAIKQKSDDPSRYSYQMPELGYLENVATKNPNKVAEIVMAVNITKENFNPEVADRFLRIIAGLPPAEVAFLSEKIKNENWVKLMDRYNQYGFDYKEMLKKLAEAKEYDGVLNLATAVLSTRDEREFDKSKFIFDEPFFIKHLEMTEIFPILLQIDNAHTEQVFGLLANVLSKAVTNGKNDQNQVFEFEDTYRLYDVDFFSLELDRSGRRSVMRENINDLAATAKEFAIRLIGGCGDEARRLYEEHIAKLSYSCCTLWRFSLFIWSLCPNVFVGELKKAFEKLFCDKWYELGEPEYLWTLKKCFVVLTKEEKSDYINKVINFFGVADTDPRKDKIKKNYALKILSCIFSDLSSSDIENAKNMLGGSPQKDYTPHAAIETGSSGWVKNKAPVELPELNKMQIEDIAKNLRGVWSPKSLYEKDGDRDFFNPLNAEGMGIMLGEDIALRPKEYIDNANLFFEKDVLDYHYTYSFLYGLRNVIEKDNYNFNFDLDKMLGLLATIRDQSAAAYNTAKGLMRREEFGGAWLADITGVYNEMADLLLAILSNHFIQDQKNYEYLKVYRDNIFNLLDYLLNIVEEDLLDDEMENKPDPLNRAINSARGRAFQALANFICIDDKQYPKGTGEKLSEDVEKLYENLVTNENTTTMMFMYGYYLAVFYYRDKKFVRTLFDKIFTSDKNKLHLFIAAAEGYLCSNLYEELFKDLSEVVYSRIIDLPTNSYPKRNYENSISDSLPHQIALAYIYFTDFDFKLELFKQFWSKLGIEPRKEFISYIGRDLILQADTPAVLQAKRLDKEQIENKLYQLWDWILKNNNKNDNQIFSEFGFWIGENPVIFDDNVKLAKYIAMSIEKSGGDIAWEAGLFKRIVSFASEAPADALLILEKYIIFRATLGPGYGFSLYENDLVGALKILYGNDKTKEGAENLINEAIKKGSSRFWMLKKVLE